MGWYKEETDDWLRRATLPIDGTKVTAAVTGITFMIDLSILPAAEFDKMDINGDDLRLTQADGTTELAIEVRTFNRAARTGFVWGCHTGTIGTSGVDICLYYDNSSASAYSAGATYGSEAVWTNVVACLPMRTATIYDHAGNIPSGDFIESNLGAVVTGKFDKCLTFNGSNSYITVDDVLLKTSFSTSITFGGWFWFDDDATQAALYMYPDSTNKGYGLWLYSSKLRCYVSTGNANYWNNVYEDIADYDTGAWYHIMGCYGSSNMKMYMNGVEVDNYSYNSPISFATTQGHIGRRGTAGEYFDGKMQHLTFETTKRPVGWVKFLYNNQGDNANFWDTITYDDKPTSDTILPYMIVVSG